MEGVGGGGGAGREVGRGSESGGRSSGAAVVSRMLRTRQSSPAEVSSTIHKKVQLLQLRRGRGGAELRTHSGEFQPQCVTETRLMDVLLPLLPPCSRSSPLFLSSFTAAINRLLSLMSSSFPLVGSFCVQVSPQNMSTPHHRLSNYCISNNSRTHTLPDSVVGFGLMLARLISTPRMPT